MIKESGIFLHVEGSGDLIVGGSDGGLDIEPEGGGGVLLGGSGGGVGVPVGEEGGGALLVAIARPPREPGLRGLLHRAIRIEPERRNPEARPPERLASEIMRAS